MSRTLSQREALRHFKQAKQIERNLFEPSPPFQAPPMVSLRNIALGVAVGVVVLLFVALVVGMVDGPLDPSAAPAAAAAGG